MEEITFNRDSNIVGLEGVSGSVSSVSSVVGEGVAAAGVLLELGLEEKGEGEGEVSVGGVEGVDPSGWRARNTKSNRLCNKATEEDNA